MNLFVSGLFNRGTENEFVELEAAAKCTLDEVMLFRYAYGKNDLPIQSETRVFVFPYLNLRKGNLVRVYTFHHKSKKKEMDESLGKRVFNFSWNLDRTIWEGMHVEAHLVEASCSVGIAPSDPMADSKRVHGDENRSTFLDSDALTANMLLAALDGRIQIIGENGKSAPIEVADVPERVKAALEAKDMDKAYALLLAECAK